MAYHEYYMDYIPDKETYKAVMYACSLMRDGNSYALAIHRACSYYKGAGIDDVRHYVAQRASRSKANRRCWDD